MRVVAWRFAEHVFTTLCCLTYLSRRGAHVLGLRLVAGHSHQQALTCRGVSALRDFDGLCHELKCGCALRAAQTQESIAAALQKQLAKMDRSRPGSEQLLEVRLGQGRTPCTVRGRNETLWAACTLLPWPLIR